MIASRKQLSVNSKMDRAKRLVLIKFAFSWLLLTAFLLTGASVKAQQSQKIYKVGRLSAGSPSDPLSKASYEAFRDGLRELGWIEGSNIVLENRWPSEPASSAVDPAAEFVRLKVDVIVAVGSPLIEAAK